MSIVETLVEPDGLADRLGDPRLRVLDVTVQITPEFAIRSGRPDWERAHIPGSVFGDLLDDLSDRAAPTLMMMLPPADQFAEAMGALGVGPGTEVVLYDARENMWAARVWWMLHAFGFDVAAVLDGGWQAWTAEPRPTCSQPCGYPPAQFVARPRPDVFVSAQAVLAAIDDPHTTVVSALGRRQHRGDLAEYGRPGHIPGAKNISAWAILDKTTGRYRPADELRELCAPVLGADRVITYCGGGIAAASLAFVLRRLGHPNVAVYDGGLLEWCASPDRISALPAEKTTGRSSGPNTSMTHLLAQGSNRWGRETRRAAAVRRQRPAGLTALRRVPARPPSRRPRGRLPARRCEGRTRSPERGSAP